MRILKKLTLTFLVLLVVILLSAYLYVRMEGRRIVAERLSRIFSREVTLGHISLTLPPQLHIEDLDIPGLMRVAEADMTMNLLLSREPTLLLSKVRLVRPEAEVSFIGLAETRQEQGPASSSGTEGAAGTGELRFSVVVQDLIVENGSVVIRFQKEGRPEQLLIRDMALRAGNVRYPWMSAETAFDMTGLASSGVVPIGEKEFLAQGSINWVARDLDARLTVLQDKDDPGLEADLVAKNNDLLVQGNVSLGLWPTPQFDAGSKAVVGMVLMSLARDVTLDFSFQTELDNFQLEKIDFSGDLDLGELLSDKMALGSGREEILAP